MTKIEWAMVIAAALLAAEAEGQDLSKIGDVQSGQKLAVQECRACHNVGAGRRKAPVQEGAPSFYDVANMASTTPTSLYVFLHTPHPSMPNFRLSKKESDDIVAYILSLRRQIQ